MPHHPRPTEYAEAPVVRETTRHMRLSLAVVAAGMAVALLLGVLSSQRAFDDGTRHAAQRIDAGADPASPAVVGEHPGPGVDTWALLFLGMLATAGVVYLAVRRPYDAALRNATELAHASHTLEESTLETFAALNATVEAKDRHTAGHGLRVTLISLLIGQELGLDEDELDVLRHAATFHDIGKIAVPDAVLQKAGRLTDEEYEAIKVHPSESARICSKLGVLHRAVPAIRGHHERMDGRGYPDGLMGHSIPLGARIIAVADTWDAITSDRPYRKGQPATVALDEIRRVAGTQFDPRVVAAFIEVLARDPWMFGLQPADVSADPAAPGQGVEVRSRASESNAGVAAAASPAGDAGGDELDWTEGFDEEHLAA